MMMRKKAFKRMLVLVLAVTMLISFSTSASALGIARDFNTPYYYSIAPGGTQAIIFVTPNGNNGIDAIIAKIERLSSSGKVIGNYYVLNNGSQYHVGSLSGGASVQTAPVAYYQQGFDGLWTLQSSDTTETIDIKVTFYKNGLP